jgi:hypothetical protein
VLSETIQKDQEKEDEAAKLLKSHHVASDSQVVPWAGVLADELFSRCTDKLRVFVILHCHVFFNSCKCVFFNSESFYSNNGQAQGQDL